MRGVATAASAPFFVPNLLSAPPSGKLRLASFGGGNMAYWTLHDIAIHMNVEMAFVADVDSARLGDLNKNYPNAKVYEDWREMLEREHKNIDIACVGTPDHMHAAQAMESMRLGLPVYVQKPLTHDIYETRKLTEFARKKGIITQMGIQRHSSKEYITAVKVIQSGAIGKVKEVHTWSNKTSGDLTPFPDRSDPIPSTLRWDLWLGTAEPRPYIADYYHPGKWRKRVDFGTATFGDMGCHIFDPVYSALQLNPPLSVRSEGLAPNKYNWAVNALIHYRFAGTPYTEGPELSITWYDGERKPSAEVQQKAGVKELPDQGSLFFGTKGQMVLPHTAMPIFYPEADFADYKLPEVEAPDHYHEFVDAVLGKTKTSTHFDYAGPLTETILLGSVATRFPNQTLQWNAKKMRVENIAEANQYLRRKYRKGWEVSGL